MPWRQKRKRRRVHYSQPLNPKHPGPAINHRQWIPLLPHAIRPRSVIHGVEAQFDSRQNLLIALHIHAGVGFRPDDHLPHNGCSERLPRALVRRDGDLLVCGVGKPVGVYEGLDGGVGGGDGDVAAGEGGHECGSEGAVLVCVVRSAGDVVFLEAEIGAY